MDCSLSKNVLLSRAVCVFQDYMDDIHGKEISLVRTTVKIPGQRPRAAMRSSSDSGAQQGQQPANSIAGQSHATLSDTLPWPLSVKPGHWSQWQI